MSPPTPPTTDPTSPTEASPDGQDLTITNPSELSPPSEPVVGATDASPASARNADVPRPRQDYLVRQDMIHRRAWTTVLLSLLLTLVLALGALMTHNALYALFNGILLTAAVATLCYRLLLSKKIRQLTL